MVYKILIILCAIIALGGVIYGIFQSDDKSSTAGAMSPIIMVAFVVIAKLKQKQEDSEYKKDLAKKAEQAKSDSPPNASQKI
ncbi:hypothetical protein N9O57_02290 [bacterium]|nr:hypothetical protein [bacterium]